MTILLASPKIIHQKNLHFKDVTDASEYIYSYTKKRGKKVKLTIFISS